MVIVERSIKHFSMTFFSFHGLINLISVVFLSLLYDQNRTTRKVPGATFLYLMKMKSWRTRPQNAVISVNAMLLTGTEKSKLSVYTSILYFFITVTVSQIQIRLNSVNKKIIFTLLRFQAGPSQVSCGISFVKKRPEI